MPRPPRFTGRAVLVRPTPEVAAELESLAAAAGVTYADVARLAIELGLPAARAQLESDHPGEGPTP
jgi:hypothetical protein